MGSDGRISNKLLVGGIFAVLIFGLVGSQQAMAGAPLNDIRMDKCVTFTESLIDNNFGEECIIVEAGVGSLLIAEEGDTGFFRIDAIIANVQEGGVASVIVQDVFPAGLEFVSSNAGVGSTSGNTYNPITGVWDVGTITEGGVRSLIIKFKVETGTCGSDIVNTASLDPASKDGTGDSNDSASATVSVVKTLQNLSVDCIISTGEVFVVTGSFANEVDEN